MGYTSYFSGTVTIEPPLNEDEIAYLKDFAITRRRHRKNGPLFIGNTKNYGQGAADDILNNNSPDPDQPGLWCQWAPSDDGTKLEWDEGEKFYYSAEWMKYIVENLLAPSAVDYLIDHGNEDPRLVNFTCGHTCNGEIEVEGEESNDRWKLIVEDNVVKVSEASLIYGEATAI